VARITDLVNDPNASASQLSEAADRLAQVYRSNPKSCSGTQPGLVDAIIAHPNTPLASLMPLINHSPAAFFRNPIAALALFEEPGLLAAFTPRSLYGLLQREQPPELLLDLLALEGIPLNPGLTTMDRMTLCLEVGLHIARAGECTDEKEWRQAFNAFWKRVLAPVRADKGNAAIEIWNWVALGFAPAWLVDEDTAIDALSLPKPSRSELTVIHRRAVQRLMRWDQEANAACLASLQFFFRFFANLASEAPLDDTERSHPEQPYPWTRRLAICLAPAALPQGEYAPFFEAYAHDGNRLVRFAARRRCADPEWSIYHA